MRIERRTRVIKSGDRKPTDKRVQTSDAKLIPRHAIHPEPNRHPNELLHLSRGSMVVHGAHRGCCVRGRRHRVHASHGRLRPRTTHQRSSPDGVLHR